MDSMDLEVSEKTSVFFGDLRWGIKHNGTVQWFWDLAGCSCHEIGDIVNISRVWFQACLLSYLR